MTVSAKLPEKKLESQLFKVTSETENFSLTAHCTLQF